MKHLTLATISVALSVALAGCGHDHKSGDKTSTSTSTTSTTTSSPSSVAPAAKAKYTIADYVKDNNISETPVHHGDPGPNVDLPVPTGWRRDQNSGTSYGGIVQTQPANPGDPPTVSALFSKLTGNVDPAKLIQYAPGEVQNLPDTKAAVTVRRPRSPVSRPGSWAARTRRTARPASSPRRRW